MFKEIQKYTINIDHVAIAVKSLEQAVEFYSTIFGFEVKERRETQGELSGMISATMKLGGVTFVLVQGTNETSNVCQYIKHYGPGVQHVAITVKNIEKVYDLLKDKASFLSGIIQSHGLYQVFTMRDENSGMMLEIIERNDAPSNFSDNNVQQLFESMEKMGVF